MIRLMKESLVRLLILIFYTILYLQEYASAASIFNRGNWVGNGGVVVQCSAASTSTLTPLDLVEETGDWIFPEGTAMEQLSAFIARVDRFSPERGALYKVLAENFMSRVDFTQFKLVPTEDIGPIQIPSDCEVLQAVVQFGFFQPKDNNYIVSDKIWRRLTESMKAVLMLHEILYYEASLVGHRGKSSYVRKYVRAIVEDRFEDMNADQYFEFMASNFLAIEFWDDSQTKRRWMLTSPVNRDDTAAGLGCLAFEGFKTPTSQDLTEAASRLFASHEAKALGLDDSDLNYWVKDSVFFTKLMNYLGVEVANPGWRPLGVGLCISD